MHLGIFVLKFKLQKSLSLLLSHWQPWPSRTLQSYHWRLNIGKNIWPILKCLVLLDSISDVGRFVEYNRMIIASQHWMPYCVTNAKQLQDPNTAQANRMTTDLSHFYWGGLNWSVPLLVHLLICLRAEHWFLLVRKMWHKYGKRVDSLDEKTDNRINCIFHNVHEGKICRRNREQ